QAQEATTLKSKANHTVGAIGAIIVLAPLNLIFVLGPFLGIAGVILGGWGAAVGIFGGAIAALVAFFTHMIFFNVGFWVHVSAFFFVTGCVGISLLLFILMAVISKVFLSLTVSYLQWNLNFIRARA
ncbi:MAG TPA: DUF1700 domain-containing protein, partial [Candidatus Baltobacteraceae bacterium]|nr:DUF1700 domain-containing protein [Candidatus Baltobacteraceae bacterium]